MVESRVLLSRAASPVPPPGWGRFDPSDPDRNLRALAGRHVVFLNWRDGDHPRAGGAELYCHRVAQRFAAVGARVTFVTSRPPGHARADRDGAVAVRRGGGTYGVYPAALGWLAERRDRVDAVVDSQNGIPFFSPLVVRRRTPVVQLLHHVHQGQFPLYYPPPVARLGQLLESAGARRVYGRRAVAAVSPSTRLEARGALGLVGPRFVVPNGLDPPDEADLESPAPTPTIVCVGRLVAHKRLELLLSALPGLRRDVPGLVVHMVGDGPAREELRRLADSLRLGPDVLRWHGFVDACARDSLLASAWLTVSTSRGEGWGLSVLEANAWGVPAVAFRVPGLRDAVREGVTGWLVPDGEALRPRLADALRLLADANTARQWRLRARRWALGFSWDRTARLLAGVVVTEADRLAVARDRRRPDRDVTLARFGLAPGQPPPLLRRTDVLEVAGLSGTAVLYGADAAAARAALRRAGVSGRVETSPAGPVDLLLSGGRG